jgi:hypothetical protein
MCSTDHIFLEWNVSIINKYEVIEVSLVSIQLPLSYHTDELAQSTLFISTSVFSESTAFGIKLDRIIL